MVGSGREWSGAVGSELETVLSISLKRSEGSKGPIGNGREWSGGRERSRKRTRISEAVGS